MVLIGVWLSVEKKTELECLAKADDRSLSSYVRRYIINPRLKASSGCKTPAA